MICKFNDELNFTSFKNSLSTRRGISLTLRCECASSSSEIPYRLDSFLFIKCFAAKKKIFRSRLRLFFINRSTLLGFFRSNDKGKAMKLLIVWSDLIWEDADGQQLDRVRVTVLFYDDREALVILIKLLLQSMLYDFKQLVATILKSYHVLKQICLCAISSWNMNLNDIVVHATWMKVINIFYLFSLESGAAAAEFDKFYTSVSLFVQAQMSLFAMKRVSLLLNRFIFRVK